MRQSTGSQSRTRLATELTDTYRVLFHVSLKTDTESVKDKLSWKSESQRLHHLLP